LTSLLAEVGLLDLLPTSTSQPVLAVPQQGMLAMSPSMEELRLLVTVEPSRSSPRMALARTKMVVA
jgi:hypothetical protein